MTDSPRCLWSTPHRPGDPDLQCVDTCRPDHRGMSQVFCPGHLAAWEYRGTRRPLNRTRRRTTP